MQRPGEFTYRVRIEARFEAAHNLRAYRGAAEPLHGHSWVVEAELEAERLDEDGIAADFVSASKTLRELAGQLDTTYLNETSPFDRINPTAENIARWFFEQLESRLHEDNAHLVEVVVHEGPKGKAVCRRR